MEMAYDGAAIEFRVQVMLYAALQTWSPGEAISLQVLPTW